MKKIKMSRELSAPFLLNCALKEMGFRNKRDFERAMRKKYSIDNAQYVPVPLTYQDPKTGQTKVSSDLLFRNNDYTFITTKFGKLKDVEPIKGKQINKNNAPAKPTVSVKRRRVISE